MPADISADIAVKIDDAPVMLALDSVNLDRVDLDPAYVERIPDPNEHASYLEAFHENVYRNLSVIHLCMGKGDLDEAAARMKQLRDHCDALWAERVQAAEQRMPA